MTPNKPLFNILLYLFICGLFISFCGCASSERRKFITHISSWEELTNPVWQLEDTLITDVDAIYDQGVWYLFYSAMYEDIVPVFIRALWR
jgi:hypothetical protein